MNRIVKIFCPVAERGPLAMLDTSNNVECLHIKRPALGKWKLQVVRSNVPQGPQEFALAWLGAAAP
jgi:hypothetical protein